MQRRQKDNALTIFLPRELTHGGMDKEMGELSPETMKDWTLKGEMILCAAETTGHNAP